MNRRFTEHFKVDPGAVRPLRADHPAVTEGRTVFPSTVVHAVFSDRIFISGANQRKLGDTVEKGPWRGMAVYCVTLEERRTCPRTCHHWNTCMGNAMHMSRRHMADDALIGRMEKELAGLQNRHPRGFVVRLHILGDFWSTKYVAAWGRWLTRYPALRVFGYSAWPAGTPIGDALRDMTDARWDRFAIRFSAAAPAPQGATTIGRLPEGPVVAEGIVCPAQTGATDCCGTCGLCWAPAAREKCIVFVLHGNGAWSRGRGKKAFADG